MTRTKNPALSLPASTRFTTRFVRFNCLACAASNLASCRLSGRERHGRVRKRGMTRVPAAGFISEKGIIHHAIPSAPVKVERQHTLATLVIQKDSRAKVV